MKVFGITGGTGAGKTTTLNVLAEMNVEILDCDVTVSYTHLACLPVRSKTKQVLYS